MTEPERKDAAQGASDTELARRVEALAEREPGWLGALRRRAFARALSSPPPRTDDERWRLTELAGLDALGPPGQPVDQHALAALTPEAELSGLLILEEGAPALLWLGSEAASQGVVLLDLASAAREHRALVEPHLGAGIGASERIAAYGLALQSGGAFLHVPPGVGLERPIQVLHRTRGALSASRSLVLLGAGAQAILDEVHLREGEGPALGLPASELFLAPGASLAWTYWQRGAAHARQLALAHASLAEEAKLEMLSASDGGELMRTQLDVALEGRGARAELLGLYGPCGAERVEHWTRQLHLAPTTRSELHYRGVLSGAARVLYHGTIQVAPEARRTDAYQANRNLLLSREAVALSNPQLEIAQNDVRCTHGATVAPIDPAQLFYLMSRGLAHAEAERLIADGFLATVLERATYARLAPLIAEALSTRRRA